MSIEYTSHAFQLRKGFMNITSGSYQPDAIFLCSVAGSLTVTWNDDTTTVIACAVGDPFTASKEEAKSIAVTTGTFQISYG